MSVNILMLYNQISELMLQEFLISWLKKRVRLPLAHTVISNASEGFFSYLNSYPPPGGGGLPYETDGDTRRLF